MKPRALLLLTLALPVSKMPAQEIQVPSTVTAGSAFAVTTTGSGKAVLYIVGPGQALRRDLQLGERVSFATGELYSAGHYTAVLATESSSKNAEFDVLPAAQPGSLGFLARPSRLPVNVANGISGSMYVFDSYHNLITTPMPATLELSIAGGATLTRTVTTRNGLAWATMNSATKEGSARFTARVGDISSTRIINQVPGEPCSISISARPNGSKLEVQTAPVRDCSGNMIPDGTIITFIETLGNAQSTVDVPLKKGIASVVMPANKGSKISAASGAVAGNEIHWDGGR
ncbi:hypothetical protein [Terriglobus albidus]|nr:hypothetical protein [Terriglobus albidus]